MEKKRMKAMGDGGAEGAVLIDATVRISQTRSEARSIRCRPGTFEHEYGAKKTASALYHAGMHFSGLWERAHISVPSPDLRRSGSTQWRGLPDSRADALSEIKAVPIGTDQRSRLIDFCIFGNTSAEIGAKWGMDRRQMASVLKSDLMSVARHFRFVG
ncbi:MAG TPA: hypothetical protein VEG32_07780 [Clostridia bacterium]|nr:hypothetical protein [Clostridia bacterium]